ncbi:uncharacterized protein LOC114534594 [Dendronephthya gigantea]|uniref:uncharacterized protein LOC114534594 n=1 Tax=Dendronephthya gigantea TaxID=151771 RepID=UPI001069F0AA|nr:uncharacterized protein LOC114534594 [Dendronephthya gigantea]
MESEGENAISDDQEQAKLPDRSLTFTARGSEIQNVIALLTDDRQAVVSLNGGPGFGKTAIAIEVSHKLREDRTILVIFSHLTTAKNADEMVRRLCLDVGVNYEHDDPKPSLFLWLKRAKAKVIFVLDDVDNLLEENNRSDFYDFLYLLRKIGNCQMITTSRASYLIPELIVSQVNVEEMDEVACMEFLRKKCPDENNECLRRLATLCGNIPLAMSIAASQVGDFEDTNEFLHYLKEQPLKTLQRPESNIFVHKAIHLSYARLDKEQKEAALRWATFEGDFSEEAAGVVIEKDKLDTKRILKNLFSRSLIKKTPENRYVIHSLIKHFLTDHLKGEHDMALSATAEYLMVKYYLKLGHDLTMQSYSKDRYKQNREALKQEAHNIQHVLKMCCEQADPTTSQIPDCMADSEIYTTSARFFSLFVRTIIPGSIVDEFLERCAQLAQGREELAKKIAFDCLLADQERSKTIGKSDEKFVSMMGDINKVFVAHEEELKQDKSLCAHYYYQNGRYLLRKAESETEDREARLDLQFKALEELEKSLKLRKVLPSESVARADEVYSLLQLGNTWKRISGSSEKSLNWRRHISFTDGLENAQIRYKEALELSQDVFGEHELTSACLKNFGDLFLTSKRYEAAVRNYTRAKKMREDLGLHASESHVYLLNNLGISLKEIGRLEEAIEVLENARDLAEKRSESEKPNACKAKVYLNLAVILHLIQPYSERAVAYAKKALELENIDKFARFEYEQLLDISTNGANEK